MSVLGIRNEIHDLSIRYEPTWDSDHHLAKSIMQTAVMTEASLRDWESKYPTDNQLARAVYLLQHLYSKIQTDDAQTKAKACAQWLIVRYSSTWYAKNVRVVNAHPGATQPAPAATSGAAGSNGVTPSGTVPATPGSGGTNSTNGPNGTAPGVDAAPGTPEPLGTAAPQ
jgi:hypothetical protein